MLASCSGTPICLPPAFAVRSRGGRYPNWAFEIECLADNILWDRDWELDDLMVDSSPEKAQVLKLHLGIDDDYFTSIAPDPNDLNPVRRTLRRLIQQKPR